MSVCLKATVTEKLLSRKTKKKMAKAAQAVSPGSRNMRRTSRHTVAITKTANRTTPA